MKDGDIITIDIKNCKITLEVSDDELQNRRRDWKCKEPTINTGYIKRYAKLVSSADKGAILN